MSDGHFLMLRPLSAGAHTLHFKGKYVWTQAVHGVRLHVRHRCHLRAHGRI